MQDENRKRLRRTTFIYWTLLFYIVAALVWWFIVLEKQNQQIAKQRYINLSSQTDSLTTIRLAEKMEAINNETTRNTGKYIAEGITFLILILIGASFVYRSVKRQFKLQQQQQNFMMAVTHELKTPIFNIQGYLDSLIDGGLDDPRVNKLFLQRAAKNVERLQTIVLDLETISRLESGQLILELQTFDIKDLAKEVFEDMEIKAAEKNLSLEFKEKASSSIKVRADREKIRQVLVNLIQNSIKYGIPNGRTRVGFYDMDRMVLVEVADNGIGIPKQHLSHIFDRFYRVDKSRSRDQGGSGLGLSIVKHIIEAHKQTINVRSTPNFGSTFGFTLEKA